MLLLMTGVSGVVDDVSVVVIDDCLVCLVCPVPLNADSWEVVNTGQSSESLQVNQHLADRGSLVDLGVNLQLYMYSFLCFYVFLSKHFGFIQIFSKNGLHINVSFIH